MNSTLSKVFMFAAGAAIGSVVAWQITKRKYDRLIDEEIESVKEAFSRYSYRGAEQPSEVEAETSTSDQITMDFEEKSDEPQDYEKYSKAYNQVKSNTDNKEVKPMDKPYVIPPEDFGEEGDYEIKSLTYYADGVLTDDWDNVIEDIDELIGEESLTHFGEYEDDSVFVRDDQMKIDYEILRDVRNFADIPRRNRGD